MKWWRFYHFIKLLKLNALRVLVSTTATDPCIGQSPSSPLSRAVSTNNETDHEQYTLVDNNVQIKCYVLFPFIDPQCRTELLFPYYFPINVSVDIAIYVDIKNLSPITLKCSSFHILHSYLPFSAPLCGIPFLARDSPCPL